MSRWRRRKGTRAEAGLARGGEGGTRELVVVCWASEFLSNSSGSPKSYVGPGQPPALRARAAPALLTVLFLQGVRQLLPMHPLHRASCVTTARTAWTARAVTRLLRAEARTAMTSATWCCRNSRIITTFRLRGAGEEGLPHPQRPLRDRVLKVVASCARSWACLTPSPVRYRARNAEGLRYSVSRQPSEDGWFSLRPGARESAPGASRPWPRASTISSKPARSSLPGARAGDEQSVGLQAAEGAQADPVVGLQRGGQASRRLARPGGSNDDGVEAPALRVEAAQHVEGIRRAPRGRCPRLPTRAFSRASAAAFCPAPPPPPGGCCCATGQREAPAW